MDTPNGSRRAGVGNNQSNCGRNGVPYCRRKPGVPVHGKTVLGEQPDLELQFQFQNGGSFRNREQSGLDRVYDCIGAVRSNVAEYGGWAKRTVFPAVWSDKSGRCRKLPGGECVPFFRGIDYLLLGGPATHTFGFPYCVEFTTINPH